MWIRKSIPYFVAIGVVAQSLFVASCGGGGASATAALDNSLASSSGFYRGSYGRVAREGDISFELDGHAWEAPFIDYIRFYDETLNATPRFRRFILRMINSKVPRSGYAMQFGEGLVLQIDLRTGVRDLPRGELFVDGVPSVEAGAAIREINLYHSSDLVSGGTSADTHWSARFPNVLGNVRSLYVGGGSGFSGSVQIPQPGERVDIRMEGDFRDGTTFRIAGSMESVAYTFNATASYTPPAGGTGYAGSYVAQVNYLVSLIPGGNVNSIAPQYGGPCQRDSLVAAAMVNAYAAKYASSASSANAYAEAMMDNLREAARLCSDAPPFDGGDPCSTIGIVPCSWLAANVP